MTDTNDTAGEQGENESQLKVYFNPFVHTVEENNEFLRLGYEPIPMQIPDVRSRRNSGEVRDR